METVGGVKAFETRDEGADGADVRGVAVGVPARCVDDCLGRAEIVAGVGPGHDHEGVVGYHVASAAVGVVTVLRLDAVVGAAPVAVRARPGAHVAVDLRDEGVGRDEGEDAVENGVDVLVDDVEVVFAFLEQVIELLAEADFTDSNCSKLVPLGFNYDYSWAMHTRMHELPKSESVASLQNQAEGLYNTKLYDNMSRMSYVTNHDDYNDKEAYPAYYSNKLGEGNYALCDVLTFTFYGMPLLYNGQEIGYPRVISFFHKEPIDWSAGDKRTTNTVSTLAYLRHTCPALSDGNAEERAEMQMLQTNPSASSMAYIKKKGDQTMLVVLNFGKEQSVYVYQTPEGEYTQVLDSRTIADGPSQRDVEIKGAPKGVCEFPMERKGYAIYIKK